MAGIVARWRALVGVRRRQRSPAVPSPAVPSAGRTAAGAGLADAVLEEAGDAVIGVGRDGRIVVWNRAAAAMLGFAREEVVGRDVADTVVPARLRESYRRGMRALWGSGGRIDRPVAAALLRRDGTEVPVDATAWTVDANGASLLAAILRDATESRRTRLSMMESRDEAVEASRRKSDFLAATSHEIRSPTSTLIGLTGLLLETDLDQAQRRYGDGIRTAGADLLGIINEILDYSTLESGRVAIAEVDFDLRNLVEDVVAQVAEAARDKGIEVVGYCQPELPVALRGDPARLRQVLLTLAGNAVKFTDRGEVAIRAARAAPADDRSASVRFEVADTGIGIAAEDRENLFDAFVRADDSTTRPGGGTGLGLTNSRRLVEVMGGRLSVDSELGQGSTFSFELVLTRQGTRSDVRGHAA